MLRLLQRIAIDISPLRASREYRLITLGQIVSNLGTQAALVALPYQIFVLSHSAALVGLLGAFELGPMAVVSLLGGALNDRMDRRRLLALAQAGVIARRRRARRRVAGRAPARARRARAGRAARRERLARHGHPHGDPAGDARAGSAQHRPRAQLRPVPGDRDHRAGLRRADHRREQPGRRLRARRGDVPGDAVGGAGGRAAPAERRRRGDLDPPFDRSRACDSCARATRCRAASRSTSWR